MPPGRGKHVAVERSHRCDDRSCGCNGIFRWKKDLDYHLNPISFCGGEVRDYKYWLDHEIQPLRKEEERAPVPLSARLTGSVRRARPAEPASASASPTAGPAKRPPPPPPKQPPRQPQPPQGRRPSRRRRSRRQSIESVQTANESDASTPRSPTDPLPSGGVRRASSVSGNSVLPALGKQFTAVGFANGDTPVPSPAPGQQDPMEGGDALPALAGPLPGRRPSKGPSPAPAQQQPLPGRRTSKARKGAVLAQAAMRMSSIGNALASPPRQAPGAPPPGQSPAFTAPRQGQQKDSQQRSKKGRYGAVTSPEVARAQRAALWFAAAQQAPAELPRVEQLRRSSSMRGDAPPPPRREVVSRDQYEALQRGFQQLDTDGSGQISVQELAGGALSGCHFTPVQLRRLECVQRSGHVDFDELMTVFFPELPAARIARYRRLYAHREQDPPAKELLEKPQLKEIEDMYAVVAPQPAGLPIGALRGVAPAEVSDDELQAMFRNCDLDCDGVLSREEFAELVKYAFPQYEPQRSGPMSLKGKSEGAGTVAPPPSQGLGARWQEERDARVRDRFRRVCEALAQLRRQHEPVRLPHKNGYNLPAGGGHRVRPQRRALDALLSCAERTDSGEGEGDAEAEEACRVSSPLPPTPPGGHLAALHGKVHGSRPGGSPGLSPSAGRSPRALSELDLGPREPPANPVIRGRRRQRL
eukprot:TRINITY_DN13550_c0_g1_i1.p1 TRINITY_DN13550_c0_g1~~TRINITY_DN13550_c0_g1_i1.p1  ORF type:complete len:729 (+),score=174.14 TRINITY_DN13550_c0_g1_i1:92-2188(+)